MNVCVLFEYKGKQLQKFFNETKMLQYTCNIKNALLHKDSVLMFKLYET